MHMHGHMANLKGAAVTANELSLSTTHIVCLKNVSFGCDCQTP